jgi:gliding motility-associated-like protein
MYVAKLSATGVWQWAVRAQGNGNSYGTDITLDNQGHVFITGTFFGPTLTLGSTTLTNTVATNISRDIFVAMLDTNGNWQWAKQAGGTQDDETTGIAAGRDGKVTITGYYSRPGATFGTTTLTVAPEANDIFVAQLTSSTGQWNWAVRGGHAAGSMTTSGLALDKTGNAYVLGTFSHTLALGAFTLQSANLVDTDIFVGKLTSTGTWVGASRAGGMYTELSGGIAVDGQDEVYITGLFQSATATFGTHTITNVNPTGGGSDIFVAKLNAALQWQWASQAGGNKDDGGLELTVDRNANVYVVGEFYSQACTIGTTVLTNGHPNGFFTDMFVAKLDGDGQWQWAVRAGGFDEDQANGVVATDQGQVYITGDYASQIATFGSFSLATVPYFTSGVVGRLISPTVSVQGDTVLCPGNQLTLTAQPLGPAIAYRWSTGATTAAITVTQAGLYRVTTTFADGQHSSAWHVVTAASVAAPAPRITGDTVLCPGSGGRLTANAPSALSYRWNTGATTAAIPITQPGTYSLTTTYSGGCPQTTQINVRALSLRVVGMAQLCAAGSTTLSAVAPGAIAWQWSTGATTPTITVNQPGTYSVQATFSTGCVLNAALPVTSAQAVIQGDSLLGPGQRVVLSAANSTATAYRWSTGETTASISVGQAGTVSVQVSYAAGCTSQAQFRVRAVPALAALSWGADTTSCEGSQVVLHVPSTWQGQAGLTYRWSTGSPGVTLAVQQPGTYSLQVQSACETRTLVRSVSFQPCLLIPNVITPNGDAYNERFVVKGLSLTTPWLLELYNRWGRLVYRSEAYQNDWGAAATPGAYYYLLRPAGGTVTYKGWLEVSP